MANSPFEYVIKSIQPAVDSLAAELVDIAFPDGTVLTGLKAIPPNERTESDSDTGIIIEVVIRKFTIAASELGREPERLMKIRWRDVNYEAVNAAGAKVWEWQDHYECRYIVNTQKVPTDVSVQSVYGNADGIAYGNQDGDGYAGASR